MERVILHSDLNNFYATCECSRDPSLKGKSVAVCGSAEERHGIVLAKNYSAKACGVTTGEAIWQAKQKCPELVVVPPHYPLYMKYSRLVRNIYERYTDKVEGFGMDECWLDISQPDFTIDDGEVIANEIREKVKYETGLTVSVGVSFNKVFAKLGSDMKKPDAVTVISKENFKEKIYGLPASDMLGVGRATTRKFLSYGIETIGDIAATNRDFFEEIIGINGVQLWNFAMGLDSSEVANVGATCPAKSFGHGTTTMFDLTTNEQVWSLVLSLAQDIGHSLLNCGQRCMGVSIMIRDSDLFVRGYQGKLLRSTASSFVIAQTAFVLFINNYDWHAPIRTITITAINLVDSKIPTQYGLFYDNEKDDKRENLECCVDELRNRYGMGAIGPARLISSANLAHQNETKIHMPTGLRGMMK